MGTFLGLDGKVALVTGAGRGIGREIALALAAAGAKVVVNDVGTGLRGEGFDAAPADEVCALIEARGGEAAANTDSVSDWDAAQAIVATALERFGRIDIVVNNAGILRDRIMHQMTPEDWDSVLKVHLYGSFYVSRAALPHFREQKAGTFVHMTSTSGLIGSIGQANYAAAKLGIVSLSRTLALEMARFGGRSNCLAPSAFSRMIESIPGSSPEEEEAFMAERAAMTRPEQIAPVVAYLASDDADGISGQIFGVRGNEIYVYSQPRPVRTLHRSDGWDLDKLASQFRAAVQGTMTPLERTRDVFSWKAI